MTQLDSELIEAAFELIGRANDGMNHTVAAAARTSDGRIVTGINLDHFTGGPCAEVVTLANAAAIRATVQTIVAVSPGKVVSPCGRCRQTLLDYWPDSRVIVPGPDNTLTMVPVRDLLPFAYRMDA